MAARKTKSILPGPAGPAPGLDEQSAGPQRPGWGPFLRGRIMSANGIASGLYIGLSLWIIRNPAQAVTLWRRLQGLSGRS